MKIKITIVANVPEAFFVTKFIELLGEYFSDFKVLDWKWSKMKPTSR